jgi:hypothetical protein
VRKRSADRLPTVTDHTSRALVVHTTPDRNECPDEVWQRDYSHLCRPDHPGCLVDEGALALKN